MASKNKTAIIIAGPTAVGKTSVAIEVAKRLGTEIISADSRQCYRELKIGVARPTENELQQVRHHFIASHSILEKVTADTFETFALQKVQEIFRQNDVAIITGGTGLYIRAFCEGMDEIPPVADEIRQGILEEYEESGLAWLQEEVRKNDPGFFQKGDIKNPHRLMRALEVFRATGSSILDFRKGKKAERPFRIKKIGLELPKENLHRNIHTRVYQMISAGLVEEVTSLIPYQHLNALQTVGYKEIFDYLKGESTLTEAVELIKRNTRQYAKRQMTWFRKDREMEWMNADDERVVDLIVNSR